MSDPVDTTGRAWAAPPSTAPAASHTSPCVCTYKRAHLLHRLLEKLAAQQTRGRLTYSVVVADNDVQQSARQAVRIAGIAASRGRTGLGLNIMCVLGPCSPSVTEPPVKASPSTQTATSTPRKGRTRWRRPEVRLPSTR